MQQSEPTAVQARIEAALKKRASQNRFRTLSARKQLIDFSSNDYLGLSRSAWMRQFIAQQPADELGATGSRLLNGNLPLAETIERSMADFFNADAALLFNSGYDANTGVLSTFIRPGDRVVYDEAIHASMHEGLKLSGATLIPIPHNDTLALTSAMEAGAELLSPKWLVFESYYSMDGDTAPMAAWLDLAEQFGYQCVVDEAHAVGCFGDKGRGLTFVHAERVFARVVTFGKALGSHGAVVLCAESSRQYLINFCKSFIYTTAPPPAQLSSMYAAVEFLKRFDRAQQQLQRNIQYFRNLTVHIPSVKGEGPVFSCLIPGEKEVKAKAALMQTAGLDIRPIVAPTVKSGGERLRISIHSFNTTEEMDLLIELLH